MASKKTKNRRRAANTSSRSRKSLHPAIIVGMVLIALAAVFLLVSHFILDTRVPVSGGGDEQPAVLRTGSDAASFRADGILTFESVSGKKTTGLTIEIAENDATRTQGLMGRTSMSESQGMLFIFPDEDWRSFWMVNTPLPLDILFIDAAREIVTIHRDTVPFSESSIPSTAQAMYVLEVNAGYCNRNGISVGDHVTWLKR